MNDSSTFGLEEEIQASNPCDDDIEHEEEKDIEVISPDVSAVTQDPLEKYLKANNLYDDLYEVLHSNGIDLETLEKYVPKHEIDKFCAEFGISYRQKLKFRKLMDIIDRSKVTNINLSSQQSSNPSYVCPYDAQMRLAMKQSLQEFEAKRKDNIDEMVPLNRNATVTSHMEVTVIGDHGVGKTSLMRKYVHGIFDEYIAATIGIDSMAKIERLSDNTLMEITIRDTAGYDIYI